ncbi:MAG: DUF177 domain-containing protein [Alphaproteobacteria bacterium]|nr:DUF177 domain-containing protein [Alphaproteobacteria bacterium]
MITTPEFSRLIDTSFFNKEKKAIPFSAHQEERDALANRFHILSIESLEATVDVIPLKAQDPFMRFDIHLRATLTQQCVISLQPIQEKIDETFSILLSHQEEEPQDSMGLLELAEEKHEVFYMGHADMIDIGEILSQYLSLFMAPYPRHRDAILDQGDGVQTNLSPLHQLKDLKKDLS